MSATQPSAALLAAAQAAPPTPSEDKLARIRTAIAATRDLEAEKADLEERLKAANISLQEHYYKLLPDLFDAAGVEQLILPAEGNQPAIEAKALPFYRANIAASWPPEKQADGLLYLEQHDAGDLIKTEVKASFNREERQAALALAQRLKAEGLRVSAGEAVAWATLTAWLKEQVEVHHWLPDLDKIGGTVGRQVRIKEKP